MSDIHLRTVELDESTLVFSFLTLAARMAESSEPVQKALVDKQLTKYWHAWGRPADRGIVAIRELDGLPVCCAWVRQLPESDEGFLAAGVVELAFAAVPSERGQGVGTRTLTRLIEACQTDASGPKGISLSVRADNPAVRLYQRFGFRTLSEIVNRVGTRSLMMKLDFSAAG